MVVTYDSSAGLIKTALSVIVIQGVICDFEFIFLLIANLIIVYFWKIGVSVSCTISISVGSSISIRVSISICVSVSIRISNSISTSVSVSISGLHVIQVYILTV